MSYLSKLNSNINIIRQTRQPLILFGAGYAGRLAFITLKKLQSVSAPVCYCDNALALQGKNLNGLPILSAEEAFSLYPNALIIVSVFDTCKFVSIKQQLINIGFCKVLHNDALLWHYLTDKTGRAMDPLKAAHLLNNLFGENNRFTFYEVLLFVTLKCTLNCKDCISLIPYQKKKINLPKENILSAAKNFLESVDGVNILPLFGGEPLLHPDIVEICTELSKSSKYVQLEIITNGTIVPNIDYTALKKTGVIFRISNYQLLSAHISELIATLEKYEIPYYQVNDEDLWYKMPYPVLANRNLKENQERYDKCFARHNNPTILNGHYYECTFAAVASMLNGFPEFKDDYIELINGGLIQSKLKKMISEKKVLSTCNYCHFLHEPSQIVPRAEQYQEDTNGIK